LHTWPKKAKQAFHFSIQMFFHFLVFQNFKHLFFQKGLFLFADYNSINSSSRTGIEGIVIAAIMPMSDPSL
jgi:hypothetical protein